MNGTRGGRDSRGNIGTSGSDMEQLKSQIKVNALKVLELDADSLNAFCDTVNRFAKEDRTNFTQIRNIYSKVRKLKEVRDIIGLRPVLAYVGARNNIQNLTNLLDDIIKDVKTEKQLNSFKKFMEMLVCYKKVHKD